MISSRRCSRTGCGRSATSTLSYVYADSTAVLGPLAVDDEPGYYDLCSLHAEALSVPRGWEVIRLPIGEPAPSADDLVALADAVREAAFSYDEPTQDKSQPADVVEVARRGHLRVLTDRDRTRG